MKPRCKQKMPLVCKQEAHASPFGHKVQVHKSFSKGPGKHFTFHCKSNKNTNRNA